MNSERSLIKLYLNAATPDGSDEGSVAIYRPDFDVGIGGQDVAHDRDVVLVDGPMQAGLQIKLKTNNQYT